MALQSTVPATERQHEPSPPPDWVPVDQRWLGLDRRSVKPGLFVIAVVILLAGVVPAINRAVAWDDETRAGDVIDMGGGITFVPPAGWELVRGIRTSDSPGVPVSPTQSSASLARAGVLVQVQGGGFAGSAADLLDQLNRNVRDSDGSGFSIRSAATSIITGDGRTGVTELITSAGRDGQLAAFTFPRGTSADIKEDTGLSFTVIGPSGSLASVRTDIDAMLTSVSVDAS